MYGEESARLRKVGRRASQAEEIVSAKALGQEEWGACSRNKMD